MHTPKWGIAPWYIPAIIEGDFGWIDGVGLGVGGRHGSIKGWGGPWPHVIDTENGI